MGWAWAVTKGIRAKRWAPEIPPNRLERGTKRYLQERINLSLTDTFYNREVDGYT